MKKLDIKKTNSLILKWGRNLNSNFSKEETLYRKLKKHLQK